MPAAAKFPPLASRRDNDWINICPTFCLATLNYILAAYSRHLIHPCLLHACQPACRTVQPALSACALSGDSKDCLQQSFLTKNIFKVNTYRYTTKIQHIGKTLMLWFLPFFKGLLKVPQIPVKIFF